MTWLLEPWHHKLSLNSVGSEHGSRETRRGRQRKARISSRGVTDAPARPIKVLIAKPGLDGHDRGAKVLARGLRDEGFEVVYTGLRQTPEMVVSAALQEDVDVVGLSILSGAHMTLLPKITAGLREQGMDDVLVTAGGIIPDADMPQLEEAGVSRVFGPGTTIREVAEYIRGNVRRREDVTASDRHPALERSARRGSARPGAAADRGREPHRGRGGGAACPLSRGRQRRTWLASPARPGRARARSSPRSSARRGASGRPVAVIAIDPSSPDHRRRDPRRPGPDAGRTPAIATCSSARWRRAAIRAGSPRARSRPRQ